MDQQVDIITTTPRTLAVVCFHCAASEIPTGSATRSRPSARTWAAEDGRCGGPRSATSACATTGSTCARDSRRPSRWWVTGASERSTCRGPRSPGRSMSAPTPRFPTRTTGCGPPSRGVVAIWTRPRPPGRSTGVRRASHRRRRARWSTGRCYRPHRSPRPPVTVRRHSRRRDADPHHASGHQDPRREPGEEPPGHRTRDQQRDHERRDGDGREQGRVAQDELEVQRQLEHGRGLGEPHHHAHGQHDRDRPHCRSPHHHPHRHGGGA